MEVGNGGGQPPSRCPGGRCRRGADSCLEAPVPGKIVRGSGNGHFLCENKVLGDLLFTPQGSRLWRLCRVTIAPSRANYVMGRLELGNTYPLAEHNAIQSGSFKIKARVDAFPRYSLDVHGLRPSVRRGPVVQYGYSVRLCSSTTTYTRKGRYHDPSHARFTRAIPAYAG